MTDPKETTPMPPGLHVLITREPGTDFFTLTLDNGHSEELEVEDTRQWFKQRGANMDKIEKALDQCWNFQRCEVIIDNPRDPLVSSLPYAPRL